MLACGDVNWLAISVDKIRNAQTISEDETQWLHVNQLMAGSVR